MTHTKEPWRLDPEFPADIQSGSGHKEIATTNPVGVDDRRRCPTFTQQEANARRIVSCVNALAVMNPDALAGLIEAAGRLNDLQFWRDENRLEADDLAIVPAIICRDIRNALARLRGET